MALLHATTLFQGDIVGTTIQNVYTVPAGNRVILRSVVVQNHAAVAVVCSVLLDSLSTIHDFNLAQQPNPGDSAEWRPWLVLGPGSVLKAKVNTVQHVIFLFSGSIYTI